MTGSLLMVFLIVALVCSKVSVLSGMSRQNANVLTLCAGCSLEPCVLFEIPVDLTLYTVSVNI